MAEYVDVEINENDRADLHQERMSDVSSKLSSESGEADNEHQIGAIRKASFNKLEKGMDDPLGENSEANEMLKDKLNSKLGTVRGILIPCLESNMFGAILFIRLPWIVGEVGILQATVIVALSVISVILTVMSLNAIVTNGKMVKSGSLYQVLRKNVGVEIGGGIGLIYIIGKIIATSMYALGAAECFLVAIDAYDSFQWSNQIVSLILCFIVAFAVLLGYSKLFFERNGMIFLAISVIGILSFIVGGIAFASHAFYGDLTSGSRIDVDNIAAVNKKDHTNIIPDFYFMLGLYFPSVSGVMGASTTFSGSLKNPGRSIPRGTLGAVFLTLATSLIIIYLFGYTVSNDELLENKLVLASLSWPISGLGYVAFTAALVGAASQNFQGIVRNIDAIVADRSVPILQQFDPSNGPKATFKLVIFAWLLVSIPCLSHDLNFLAPIVAILFLIVYATINGACFLLSITKSPGFRPHFKYFSWHTALVGLLWCLVLMFVISWWLTLILIFIAVVMIAYIVQSAATTEWGDAVSGIMFNQIRDMLLYMTRAEETHHAKNWRPQILIITRLNARSIHDTNREYDVKVEHENLIRLAGQLKKGKGLTVVAALIQGNPTSVDRASVIKSKKMIENFMSSEHINGFASVGVVSDTATAFDATIQMSGVGALTPNTYMCEWPAHWERLSESAQENHLNRYKTVTASKKALIVVKGAGKLPNNQARLEGNVDIYWVVHDGGLLLLLPYLLSLNKVWRRCTLRLFVVLTRLEDNAVELKARALTHLQSVRINATVETVDLLAAEAETCSLYEKTMDNTRRNSLLKKMEDYNTRKNRDISVSNSTPSSGSQLANMFSPPPQASTPTLLQSQSIVDLEKAESEAIANKAKMEASHHNHHSPGHAEVEHHKISNESEGIKLTKVKTTLAPPISEKNMVEAIRQDSVVKAQTYNVGQGKMLVALNFNRILREQSRKAKLVITNMPLLTRMTTTESIVYINTVTQDIEPVLLVRGSGEEVISTYG